MRRNHAMRTRRIRAAVRRRKMDSFAEILRRGGSIAMASGVFDAVMASSDKLPGIEAFGIPVHVNRYLPPGWMVAISKDHNWPFDTRVDSVFNLEHF